MYYLCNNLFYKCRDHQDFCKLCSKHIIDDCRKGTGWCLIKLDCTHSDPYPVSYNDLQTREHIECNHTEPRADHFQHPMQRETKHSVFLYQSMCNVTWTTSSTEFFNRSNKQGKENTPSMLLQIFNGEGNADKIKHYRCCESKENYTIGRT